jgi:hypothetical protein
LNFASIFFKLEIRFSNIIIIASIFFKIEIRFSKTELLLADFSKLKSRFNAFFVFQKKVMYEKEPQEFNHIGALQEYPNKIKILQS